jgi:hypothetical protein
MACRTTDETVALAVRALERPVHRAELLAAIDDLFAPALTASLSTLQRVLN